MLGQANAQTLEDPTKVVDPNALNPATPPAPVPTTKETAIDKSNPMQTIQGYNPEQVKMEKGDTVESRVSDIIKNDSPLMQIARTNANQASNSKGLLNSSMAVGAAQKSVMEAATPIATSDATTSKEFKLSNQMEANKAGQFNAGEVNKGNETAYQLSEQGKIDLQKIAANIAGDSRLINEKGEIDLKLQGEAAKQQTDLQAKKGEIDKMLIGADAEAKKGLNDQMAVIDKQMEELKNLHLKQLTAQKAAIDRALQDAAAKDAQVLERIKGDIDKEIAAIQARTQITTARIGADTSVKVATINSESAIKQIAAKGFVDFGLQQSSFANDVTLQGLNATTQKEMAAITAANQTLIQSNSNASGLITNYSNQVSQIMLSPDLSYEQKNKNIAALTTTLNAGLKLAGSSTTDYADLLDFKI